jgi:hypothetical protein
LAWDKVNLLRWFLIFSLWLKNWIMLCLKIEDLEFLNLFFAALILG